jgi:nucleotide-binding universal stress UspA family protein
MSGNPAGPIVVGVDGSVSALHAVRWAAAGARERRRELRLIHAIDDVSLNYPRPLPTRQDLRGALAERGRRLLLAAQDAAREVAPKLAAKIELSYENPVTTLLAESRSASMLVLGTSGLRRLGRIMTGSVSIALAARAECPVALVRGHLAEDAPPTEGPVVVGVDGSPSSEDAIAIAFEEASWRNAPLLALHSWDDGFLSAVFEETRLVLDKPAVEEHERELLAQRLAGWQEKYPDVHVDRAVTRGRPQERLLDVADRARMIIVGCRGRGGFKGMVLGSTSQNVMSYALCPVIVARHHRHN